jgi:hypothetical protein
MWQHLCVQDVGSSKWPNCGGANGSIRFDPELRHAANGGLSVALALLESMSEKYPQVSYADMFQLASATSVEVRLHFHNASIPFEHKKWLHSATLKSTGIESWTETVPALCHR